MTTSQYAANITGKHLTNKVNRNLLLDKFSENAEAVLVRQIYQEEEQETTKYSKSISC